jgi:hypothetical protein
LRLRGSTLAGHLFKHLARLPALMRLDPLEKWAQDRIVTQQFIPPAARLGLPVLAFLIPKLLLGEWIRGLRYPFVRLTPS